MRDLWIPEAKPPQVTDGVVETIMVRMLAGGLTRLYSDALPLLEIKQRFLTEQIKKVKVPGLAFEEIEDSRPIRAVRTSAVLAHYAYLESGYDSLVEPDAIQAGNEIVEKEGATITFLSSLGHDAELQHLIEVICDAPELQDGGDVYNYPRLFELGAGCVRHYMAVAA